MATKRYKRDFKGLEARRRRGMRMLARGVAQAEVARACGVSRQTASSWAQMRAEDAQAWRRRALGRPGAMSQAERAKLGKLLVAGALSQGFPTELWMLARIGKLIRREFGHAFSSVHVWRIVRELGFSSQRPIGRALERDESAILAWKKRRWPALKKASVEFRVGGSTGVSADGRGQGRAKPGAANP